VFLFTFLLHTSDKAATRRVSCSSLPTTHCSCTPFEQVVTGPSSHASFSSVVKQPSLPTTHCSCSRVEHVLAAVSSHVSFLGISGLMAQRALLQQYVPSRSCEHGLLGSRCIDLLWGTDVLDQE